MLSKEAVLFYAEHPVEYILSTTDLKMPCITREAWIKLSHEEKDAWQVEHKNELTWQQVEVLRAIPRAIKEKKGIAVKSGHGTGKTAIESLITLWFIGTRPFPRIIATAPTQKGLYDVFWSELAKWHNRWVLKSMFEWKKTRFENIAFPDTWFATARTSNKPENMAGFHEEHLLFIVDEASGVPAEILEVIEGTQAQQGCLVIYFGNPTQISGGLFEAFHGKRKFFDVFTFNAEESPLVDWRYCEKNADKYGRDSDFYRVRVLGEFPKAEPDTLISLDIIEKSLMREVEKPDPRFYEVVELGVDVARFGDAETTIYSRIGDEITEEVTYNGNDTMYTADKVANIILSKFKHKTTMVNIDDTGVGGGVTDRLKQMVVEGILPKTLVYGVNNGSNAKEDDVYVNLVTEMWYFMKNWLKDKGKIPNDNDLVAQLSTRKHTVTARGKNIIESKEQMKARGLPSPDRADGAILTLRSLVYGFSKKGSKLGLG